MPADDGRGPDDEEAVAPAAPEASEEHPVDSIPQTDAGVWDVALEHRDLLAKGEVLQGQRGARQQNRPEQGQEKHVPGIGWGGGGG